MSESDIERRWWKEAVVYQVYPRSFNDTDGDGVGDLPGIVEKVDYLDDLGVDVVWLNPVYESPNADMGYDVSDYRAIMTEFGDMADWERLADHLHDRGIRLIMDLVVNHTSDEHEWFRRSRAREDPYDDYYWWREGVDAADVEWEGEEGPEGEAPPNGWQSIFGGPAWAYDDGREEWYLHLFDRKQPDLYWPNPDLREAVYDMMQWWLDKGIDGFRLDAIAHLSKAEGLPTDVDEPMNGTMTYAGNGPRVHDYLTEMNERVLDRDLLTVGEVGTPTVPRADADAYMDPERDGLSMLVHFEHMRLDQGESLLTPGEVELPDLKRVLDKWHDWTSDEGWTAQYLSNHDQPRQVSRFGSEAYRRESAKLLGTLLHTLRGTPFVYQGEEIGMTNYPWSSLDQFQDVATINPIQRAIDRGEIDSFDDVREAAAYYSRDNGRTPVQWTDGDEAGFTDGDPWLVVNPDKERVNVADARDDPDSVWHYYRDLIELRSDEALGDVLVYGEYEQLTPEDESLWVYTRGFDGEHLFVTLNFSDDPTEIEFADDARVADGDRVEGVIGNYGTPESTTVGAVREATLRPWEARVFATR